MAYVATVTVTQVGPTEYLVEITETGASATDTCEVAGVPYAGKVIRQATTKTSGDATTVAPVLGRVDPPSDDPVVVATAAATVDVQGTASYVAITQTADGTGTLWHTSGVDGGSNNVLTSYYHITPRW